MSPSSPRPDPLSVPWPRRTAQTTLRPLTLSDVDAMWSYRSLPQVCTFLSHPPLTRGQVIERIEGRISGSDPTPGRLVRGLAVAVDGVVVGDAMLRVQAGADGEDELWIGYALHPMVWGRGIATEVARALVAVGPELGLEVWADVVQGNLASQRVLEKVGFRCIDVTADDTGLTLMTFRVPGEAAELNGPSGAVRRLPGTNV